VLKLHKQLFKKLSLIYATSFSLFLIFTFVVLKLFLPLETALYVGAMILVMFVVFSLLFFLFLRFYLQNIETDLDAITKYIQDINEKEYASEVKIVHYVEFLHLSVLMKNIAKRLYQRDKKSSKK